MASERVPPQHESIYGKFKVLKRSVYLRCELKHGRVPIQRNPVKIGAHRIKINPEYAIINLQCLMYVIVQRLSQSWGPSPIWIRVRDRG